MEREVIDITSRLLLKHTHEDIVGFLALHGLFSIEQDNYDTCYERWLTCAERWLKCYHWMETSVERRRLGNPEEAEEDEWKREGD
jgi:hypothetical protein